jgi:integrase
MRCDALTADISQGFVNKLIENGLSVATVQSIFNLVKSSVEEANGSVFAVRFPRQVKKQVEYLSVEEQKRLEQAAMARCGTDYIAVMLCLYTGIRIGEVCGLRWSDINFECRVLYVNRTMQRIRADGETRTELAFLAPKSATSAREIPLPDFLLAMLRDREQTAKTEYVLTYKNKPIEPRTLQYRFKRILEAAEVKDVCWHTTRHTFATRALENGFDVKSLSEILGHGSATVTLNKYAHASTEHKRGCMNALSAVYSSG